MCVCVYVCMFVCMQKPSVLAEKMPNLPVVCMWMCVCLFFECVGFFSKCTYTRVIWLYVFAFVSILDSSPVCHSNTLCVCARRVNIWDIPCACIVWIMGSWNPSVIACDCGFGKAIWYHVITWTWIFCMHNQCMRVRAMLIVSIPLCERRSVRIRKLKPKNTSFYQQDTYFAQPRLLILAEFGKHKMCHCLSVEDWMRRADAHLFCFEKHGFLSSWETTERLLIQTSFRLLFSCGSGKKCRKLELDHAHAHAPCACVAFRDETWGNNGSWGWHTHQTRESCIHTWLCIIHATHLYACFLSLYCFESSSWRICSQLMPL